ncbi:hypothetical protein EMIHUDRAFT_452954 [Emiliania huxleyi CCMP1516]|uniref:SCP domain-containing protein n=2 Tax=Emiliania huxleyi TaxID=2903 RepID=A0A0D3ICS5_EMIH1|nr:hypothetical protein EMIHUDRAFT_452954 [Emiliania huxleyi CCMP1516]EOD09060.1 hypothetical protein EMIHUDRAFT_452954 [Emiliania huxleyi CCMP1516]|eukprot:XP_005761489.1 hypothetical protein EMIHUDRAFT_452954 [Emiliania huxleyi CCMP1516]
MLLRCANVGSLLLASNALRNVAKMSAAAFEVDPEYPGTAIGRMRASVERAKSLTADELSVEWEDARKRHLLLWAAGLRDLTDVPPGQGYTGHAFNDYNHCDATCMLGDVAHNLNDGQDRVAGIAVNNRLGPGIERASLPELGVGGSWSTCTNGCNREPPRDVAHVQFRSRVAFKLVWCPPTFASFVLVDDAGGLLCSGTPRGALPALRERQANFDVVRGSKDQNNNTAFC